MPRGNVEKGRMIVLESVYYRLLLHLVNPVLSPVKNFLNTMVCRPPASYLSLVGAFANDPEGGSDPPLSALSKLRDKNERLGARSARKRGRI